MTKERLSCADCGAILKRQTSGIAYLVKQDLTNEKIYITLCNRCADKRDANNPIQKMRSKAPIIIIVIQTILHYLGIIAMILSIPCYIVKNFNRGNELLIGGVCWIILKYLIGAIYLGIKYIRSKKE